MCLKTLVLTFFVQFRIMVETELDGAADDLFGCDEAVGFGNDFSIN